MSPLEELIAELYRVMFERHPYLRSLLPESMAFQQAHLVGIFRYLIGNLHRTDEMIGTFAQLGRRTVPYAPGAAAAGVPAMHPHHDSTGIVRVIETSASTTRTALLSA
ncbi:hypothetical protein [Streptomyces sp. NPDC059460]|uniref:hypothetical protein n=1 Tax=Streptomyces sp. NPDC059460 TaxID=3346840 RepID=UPI0036D12C4A